MTDLANYKINKQIEVLTPIKPKSENIIFIYIIPSDIECFMNIEQHMIQHQKEKDKNFLIPMKDIHTLVIPRIDTFCYDFVNRSNYRPEFNVHNVYIDVYPLDYDLLSLEENDALYNLYIHKNVSVLSKIARIVAKIEELFGQIKFTYFKGNLAKFTYDAIKYEEDCSNLIGQGELEGLLSCFIFDRSVDFISLFCSQYTYEGMLDELFNIKLNKVKLSTKVLGQKKPEKPVEEEKKEDEKDKKKKKGEEKKEEEKVAEVKEEFITLDFSEKEKFYYMIKDYHFGKVINFLPNRLRQHEELTKKAKKTREMTEVQKYLGLYTQAKEERYSLMNHINIAEYIVRYQKHPYYKAYLEFEQALLTVPDIPDNLHNFYVNKIWSHANKNNLLKLLCLESLTHCGLGKYYDEFKKDYLSVYGYQDVILMKNLEKLKILFQKDKEVMNYGYIFKQLNLLSDDLNVHNPTSPSYVFSGLCPIIVRIIENVMNKGWNSQLPILSKIPGLFTGQVTDEETSTILNRNKEKENLVLVVFLGGVTYAEIGALRMLGKISGTSFIILTTHILTTNRLFNEMKGDFTTVPYSNEKYYKDYVQYMKEREKK